MHRRCLGDALAMHRRLGRCVGDVRVKETGLCIGPHRRCIGDAAQLSPKTKPLHVLLDIHPHALDL
eukprot:5323329-Pyramimonas_sp.AAC.1